MSICHDAPQPNCIVRCPCPSIAGLMCARVALAWFSLHWTQAVQHTLGWLTKSDHINVQINACNSGCFSMCVRIDLSCSQYSAQNWLSFQPFQSHRVSSMSVRNAILVYMTHEASSPLSVNVEDMTVTCKPNVQGREQSVMTHYRRVYDWLYSQGGTATLDEMVTRRCTSKIRRKLSLCVPACA